MTQAHTGIHARTDSADASRDLARRVRRHALHMTSRGGSSHIGSALSIADMASKNDGVEATAPFGEVAGESVKGHGGFAFRKEDTALYEAFNAELKEFLGTPEHIALVEPHGFGKAYLPNKTTEELCAGE